MSHLLRPTPPPRSDELVTDDGEPMESARHFQQMALLIHSLELAWSDRTDFYAGGNMFLYFSETQARHNDFRGPDFFLRFFGTTRRERKAWVVWEEDGAHPRRHHRAVVGVDGAGRSRRENAHLRERAQSRRVLSLRSLVGRSRRVPPLHPTEGGYRRKNADSEGRLHRAQAGLWLGKVPGRLHGVDADWLRWIDAEGHTLPALEEQALRTRAEAQRAEAESQRADAEAQRADAEARRANQSAAELSALKAKAGQ